MNRTKRPTTAADRDRALALRRRLTSSAAVGGMAAVVALGFAAQATAAGKATITSTSSSSTVATASPTASPTSTATPSGSLSSGAVSSGSSSSASAVTGGS